MSWVIALLKAVANFIRELLPWSEIFEQMKRPRKTKHISTPEKVNDAIDDDILDSIGRGISGNVDGMSERPSDP